MGMPIEERDLTPEERRKYQENIRLEAERAKLREYAPRLEELKQQIGAMFPRCEWSTQEYNAESRPGYFKGIATLHLSLPAEDKKARYGQTSYALVTLQRDQQRGVEDSYYPIAHFTRNSWGIAGSVFRRRKDGSYNLAKIRELIIHREESEWKAVVKMRGIAQKNRELAQAKKEELGELYALPCPQTLSLKEHQPSNNERLHTQVSRREKMVNPEKKEDGYEGRYSFYIRACTSEQAFAILSILTMKKEEK